MQKPLKVPLKTLGPSVNHYLLIILTSFFDPALNNSRTQLFQDSLLTCIGSVNDFFMYYLCCIRGCHLNARVSILSM